MSAGGDLAALVDASTTALAARVDARGVLSDVRGPTPTDHYASTFLALALATRAGDGDLDLARSLVDAWHAGEPRGHVPFNRLALALLSDVAPDLADASTWERWRAACPLRDDDPSNNWRLLSATCRVLEGGDAEPFDRLLDRWTTPAGGFVDGPVDPGAVPVPGGEAHAWRGSTPIAYHAKATLLAALVHRAAPSPERAARLASMRAWLAAFSDAGVLGAFGRSTMALFGDACAHAVWLDAIAREEPDAADAAARLEASVARLEAARGDEGLLPLTPAGFPESLDGWDPGFDLNELLGWDPYMHLSVYGSYHAGLVAWALERGGTDTQVAPRLAQPTLHDEDAGLLALRSADGCALVATRGQPVQSYGVGVVDLRYAGCRVFHRRRGERLSTSSSARLPIGLVFGPRAAAGATPLFVSGPQVFGAVEARTAPCVAIDDGVALVVAAFVPQRLHHLPPARWSPGWWAENVDHVLAKGRGRRARALRAPTLDGVELVSVLAIDLRAGRTAQAWWIHARGATWLNPCASAGSGVPTHARAARLLPTPAEVELGEAEEIATADAQGWARRASPAEDPSGLWRLDEADDGEPDAAWLDVRVEGERLVVVAPWASLAVDRAGRPSNVTG